MIEYCLGKSSNGKFRFWQIECDEEYHENDYEGTGFLIQRSYGQVGGKTTYGPPIYVPNGKAKRTAREQMELQFKSELKKQLDKGYKLVEKHPDEYTTEELQAIYGDVKMREGATVKPMLAKKESDIKNRKIFDKEWYISRKINGVRCLIYFDGKEVKTASRGATNYDLAIIHIIQHPLIEQFFKKYPNAILDGEVYNHAPEYSLNVISGICRTQKTVEDGKDLEFYWYDIVDLEKSFKERFEIMKEYAKELQLTEFDPYRKLNENILHIQFVPQTKISGFNNMKKLHDEWVSKGWEGAVIRNADSVYKPGSRGNDWIKIKSYYDSTFKVIGYKLGLRGSEDMTFTCEMEDGQTFEAAPLGDRATKEEYVQNFESKYKDHLGDCKYFELSPYGKPQQPHFLHFRFDLE